MGFLRDNNAQLDHRYDDIAALYQQHGSRFAVRWDYAFFQMLLETNYLRYTGDSRASQNNFAGIGTTGGGVRGNAFPDVSTGVLAQIQHLVAYSGEHVQQPVAPRTRDNQDDIIAISKRLGRPVRFSDLSGRWAVTGKYTGLIEAVGSRFFAANCPNPQGETARRDRGNGAQVSTVPAPTVIHTGRLIGPPQ